MTPYASVALYRRGSSSIFRPPRKERPADGTQARKAAMRYWRNATAEGDTLTNVYVVRDFNGRLDVAEHTAPPRAGVKWFGFPLDYAAAARHPHLAACMAELGIDARSAPPPMPDVLEINGVIYRREI